MSDSINDFIARSKLFIKELDRRENPVRQQRDGDNKNDGGDAAKSPQAYL